MRSSAAANCHGTFRPGVGKNAGIFSSPLKLIDLPTARIGLFAGGLFSDASRVKDFAEILF